MIRTATIVAICALTTASALAQQGREIPFSTIDLSAPPPIEPTSPDRMTNDRMVAVNPGAWAPAIVEGAADGLRSSGNYAEADAFELLGRLRFNTMHAVCSTGADKPEATADQFHDVLGRLVYFERRARPSSFIGAAARRALELDSASPWAFSPLEGWCRTGFFSEDGKIVVPRDVAAFWAYHDRQRTLLTQVAATFENATAAALAANVPPFALGAPPTGHDADARRFLALLRPTHTLRPLPGKDLVGGFVGISPDAETVAFKEINVLQLRNLMSGVASTPMSLLPQVGTEARFMPNGDPVIERLSRSFCEGANWVCGRTPSFTFSRTNARSGQSREFNVDVPALPQTLSWSGSVVGATDNRRYILILASAMPRPEPALRSRLVLSEKQALVVLDFEQGAIVGIVTNEEAPALFPKSFPGVFLSGTGPKDLEIVASSGHERNVDDPNQLVLGRFSLGTRRFSTLARPLAKQVNSASVAPWVIRGYDVDAALVGCRALSAFKSCSIIGPTPDKRYWLIAEEQYQQSGRIALVDARSGEVAGALGIYDHYSLPLAGPPYAAGAGALVLMFGPEAQVYVYQPSHARQ